MMRFGWDHCADQKNHNKRSHQNLTSETVMLAQANIPVYKRPWSVGRCFRARDSSLGLLLKFDCATECIHVYCPLDVGKRAARAGVDTELIDEVCLENEKSLQHMQGVE
jgi:hypothetical protein